MELGGGGALGRNGTANLIGKQPPFSPGRELG